MNALTPGMIMVFPGVCTVTRKDARNLLKNRPEARARFRHLLPLIQCVNDFAVTYMTVFQGCHEHAVPVRGPWIVVLGDDTFDALGPEGFHGPSLNALFGAADEAVIVAGWPERLAYNTAATHAARHRRNVIVIETRTTRHEEWLAALRAVKPDIGALICLPLPQEVPA
jgi:hypothetical protein